MEKRIPSGAGLGGGSSDAAATLKAVRELHDLPIDDARLEALGAQLGSDVPFFIRGGTSWCRGCGEELEPVDFSWELPVLLLGHAIEIPTPWAYRKWANSKEVFPFPYAPQPMPWGAVFNDLERPAFAKFLILGETKRWLLEQHEAAAACMTGSGSALFAILKDSRPATRSALVERLQARYGETLWIA